VFGATPNHSSVGRAKVFMHAAKKAFAEQSSTQVL
jgi:hypothetical protein